MKLLGGKKHLQGSRLANQTRQTLRAAPPGDESECRPAMSEDGTRPGDAMRASQSKIEAATHAVAVNYRYGWNREVLDSAHQPLPHLREPKCLNAVEFGDFVKVRSRGEEVIVAGNEQLFGRSCSEVFNGFGQGEYTRASQAVGAVVGD